MRKHRDGMQNKLIHSPYINNVYLYDICMYVCINIYIYMWGYIYIYIYIFYFIYRYIVLVFSRGIKLDVENPAVESQNV